MTDDKPYRGGASGPPPFRAPRAELVAELDVIMRMDYDLRDDPLRDELERRRLELARQLFPIRPTAADWEREDIITSRAHEMGVDKPPPLDERVEVCILGGWQSGTLLSEEPDGSFIVRPDGWKSASRYAPGTVRRLDVHEPPPSAERKSASEQLMDDAEGWAGMARRSKRTLRMQEFARDILDLGSRKDLLDGPQYILHKVLERAQQLAELVLGEPDA